MSLDFAALNSSTSSVCEWDAIVWTTKFVTEIYYGKVFDQNVFDRMLTLMV